MPRKLPNPDDGVPSVRPSGEQLRMIEGEINSRVGSPSFSGEKEDYWMGKPQDDPDPKNVAYRTGQQKAY